MDTTIEPDVSDEGSAGRSGDRSVLALVVAWCGTQPERLGELLRVPDRAPSPEGWLFGRGGGAARGEPHRLALVRQRPASVEPAAPLDIPFLSRTQLAVRRDGDALVVANRGRCPLRFGGRAVDEARVAAGDALELAGQLVLVCVRRPLEMAPLRDLPADAVPAFGEPDASGIVGESPVVWHQRDQTAFVARRNAHVVLTGESGVGKELVAHAIHRLSARAGRPFVARNAATFPPGILDAELFGNVKNYPNPGMPERPGLVGEADRGTLFLDEIGELPHDQQTHLLRVLDAGEYQRLGETGRRRSDFRLVAATNRPLAELKGDLVARLPLRLELPGLDERIEDVPLLARHLLRRTARDDAEVGERFFAGGGERGEPRIAPALVVALLAHRFQTHVRELDAILWQSVATSDADRLELTPAVEALLDGDRSSEGATAPLPSRDAIVAALERCGGVQEKAWRELGLANRYVLKRLVKKLGIAGATGAGGASDA